MRCAARPPPARARYCATLQAQAGFGGKMKHPFAHRMPIPSSRIPLAPGKAVAGIKKLGAFDTAKARHRKERGGLHLDYDASFAAAAVHPRPRFAIDRIGGPGLAADIVVMIPAELRLYCGERARRGCDLARGLQIMK